MDAIPEEGSILGHHVLKNYIVPGLESHLVRCARVFCMTREQEHFVTPHSHRYTFAALVLHGIVHNTLYVERDYNAPLLGDMYVNLCYDAAAGEPMRNTGHCRRYSTNTSRYGKGEWYSMRYDQIHTIAFARGTKVLILEGEDVGLSHILEPVVDGTHLHTFHRADWMQRSKEID